MNQPIEPATQSIDIIPYVPLSTGWSVSAARPLAKALFEIAPELSSLRLDQLQAIGFIEQLRSETEADRADLVLNIIKDQLEGMARAFASLQHALVITGRHVQAQNELAPDPTNLLKASSAQEYATNATFSKTVVRDLIAELELELPLWINFDQAYLYPADILNACTEKIQHLQAKWLAHLIKHQSLQMKMQTQAVYILAANCLGAICDLGLTDVLTFDPPPEAQMDVIAALEESIEYPFSGSWPKSITINSTVNPSSSGGKI